MRALLDTHVFLWWVANDRRLSQRAREVLGQGELELVLSAASAWEMAIKSSLGKLAVTESLGRFLHKQMALNRIQPLPVTVDHAVAVAALPHLHRDPFDRMLVAQAQVENLALVTGDPLITAYPVEVIW